MTGGKLGLGEHESVEDINASLTIMVIDYYWILMDIHGLLSMVNHYCSVL